MSSATHILISASAGTGKTFQLSNRYLGLLQRGVMPDQILATTFTRKAAGEILDRVMVRLGGRFPGYGFATHKGYGTAAHMELIRMLGPSPVHRLSYEPVKSLCR